MANQEVVVKSGGGIGFGGLLAILFIGLKLGGVINWSWLWVLSPLWIPLAIVVGILVLVGVIAGLVAGCGAIFGSMASRKAAKQRARVSQIRRSQ